jgi:uncharacterized membrane protein YedE/YeeE
MLIGLAASLAWSFARRVAGVSGILGGFLRAPSTRGFRPGFLAGLVLTSVLLGRLAGSDVSGRAGTMRPLAWIAIAGLLVGFGTQLGSGCTSGHGVCGLSRLSLRSLVATVTFMSCAAVVVFVTRHAWAGAAP